MRLTSLEELLAVSDFITVHLPKNPETVGLIGDRELHQVRPSVRIVNAARGGIVNEDALALAIKDGTSMPAVMQHHAGIGAQRQHGAGTLAGRRAVQTRRH